MPLLIVKMSFAAHTSGLHLGLKAFHRRDWNQIVLAAEKDDGRRGIRSNVMRWRKLLDSIANPLMTPAPLTAVIKDGIEQDQRIGDGRNFCIILGIIASLDH